MTTTYSKFVAYIYRGDETDRRIRYGGHQMFTAPMWVYHASVVLVRIVTLLNKNGMHPPPDFLLGYLSSCCRRFRSAVKHRTRRQKRRMQDET